MSTIDNTNLIHVGLWQDSSIGCPGVHSPGSGKIWKKGAYRPIIDRSDPGAEASLHEQPPAGVSRTFASTIPQLLDVLREVLQRYGYDLRELQPHHNGNGPLFAASIRHLAGFSPGRLRKALDDTLAITKRLESGVS